MKISKRIKTGLKSAAVASTLMSASLLQPLQAGNLMNPFGPASCSGFGCNSLTETKLYQKNNPISFQIWANAGECLAIGALDLGGNDIELSLVSPNQFTYNEDFFIGSGFEEMYVVAPYTGVHTLVMGHYLGTGVGSRLQVSVGRYFASDSVNCPFDSPQLTNSATVKSGKVSIDCDTLEDCRMQSPR